MVHSIGVAIVFVTLGQNLLEQVCEDLHAIGQKVAEDLDRISN